MEIKKDGGFQDEVPSIRQQMADGVRGYFANPQVVRNLAIGNVRMYEGSVAHTIVEKNAEERLGLLTSLMRAAGADESGWGQDERDASVALFDQFCRRIIDDELRPVDKTDVADAYIATVKEATPIDDYFGAPHTLYELGSMLSKRLGSADTAADAYRINMKVRDAWSDYLASADFDFKDQAKGLVEGLSTNFILSPVQANEGATRTWEWARSRPQMDDATTVLHDTYLDVTRKEKNFRRFLAGQTPHFQEYLQQKGVKLADFWNVADVEATSEALRQIAQNERFSPLLGRLDANLAQSSGIGLDTLVSDNELAMLYADQIVESVQQVRRGLTGGLRDPSDTYNRIVDQAEGAVHATKKSKKLKPVLGFLRSLGLPTDMDAAATVQFLNDANTQEQIIELLRKRNEELIELDRSLAAVMPEKTYENLVFMRRDESDLYAADETLDCTAYHYENGFNAWTVPNWLAEPAFTMAYIHDGPTRLAKLGLLLAQDENGPRLVIDSIETSKQIEDEHADGALVTIMQGIAELQEWADSRGFGDVFFCTFTNSSELAMEMPVTRPARAPHDLVILGGGGRSELWSALSGPDGSNGKPALRASYWQSEAGEDDDEIVDHLDNAHEAELLRDGALSDLEAMLSSGGDQEIIDTARAGDVEGTIAAYIARNAPLVYRVFGNNTDLYSHLYQRGGFTLETIVKQQIKELQLAEYVLQGVIGAPHIEEEIAVIDEGWGTRKLEWLRNNVRVQEYELLGDEKKSERLRREVEIVDKFFDCLMIIDKYGSLQEALRLIFGVTAHQSLDDTSVQLNKELKIINRSLFGEGPVENPGPRSF